MCVCCWFACWLKFDCNAAPADEEEDARMWRAWDVDDLSAAGLGWNRRSWSLLLTSSFRSTDANKIAVCVTHWGACFLNFYKC